MTQPPVPPPAGPPPAAPPPAPPTLPPAGPPASGKSFAGSKAFTIGAIVGGVVLAGVIGGAVALALGGGDDDEPEASGQATNSGILDPKPVGSVDAPAEPEEQPEEEPEEQPEEEPAEEPEPEVIDTGGDVLDLSGVGIVMADGWSLMGDPADDSVALTDEAGSWVYALTGVVEPTADAAGLLSSNLDYFIGADNYSQVDLGEVTPLDPFGSVVSGAFVDYGATWVDSQGSMPIYGRIYAAVRQDGTALLMSAEHAPPEEFEDSQESWGPVVEGSFNLFGGS